MQTFLKFSIVCALFIIAFSFGFHALLAEHANFASYPYTLVKTFVMWVPFDTYKNLGRGGRQVVSVLAFYFDDPSSNPAEANSFFL